MAQRRGLTEAEAPAPASVESLTEDLLAAILIRLPTLNDLGRAACACPAFRRVIADRAFLRRVRASHPPLLLGFLLDLEEAFRAVEPPYPSAPAGRAVDRAADFSFSFMPDLLPSSIAGRNWEARDARDAHVLLQDSIPPMLTQFAVCDPLFRRFVMLPPIPDDLASAVEQPRVLISPYRRFEVFLVPLLRHEEEEETSFRVVWMAQCPTKLVTFVFSSVTGQWQSVASPTLQDLNPAVPFVDHPFLFNRSYAYGCFYWMMYADVSRNFLVLDMARMEFSLLEYPPEFCSPESAIVEAGEGRLGMFSFDAQSPESFQLKTFSTIRPYQAEGANEWKYLSEAALPYQYTCQMLGVANGRLLMQVERIMEGGDVLPRRLQVRSVALNTDYETVLAMTDESFYWRPVPFLGYPPSLSSPTIIASVPDEGDLQEPALSLTESG